MVTMMDQLVEVKSTDRELIGYTGNGE